MLLKSVLWYLPATSWRGRRRSRRAPGRRRRRRRSPARLRVERKAAEARLHEAHVGAREPEAVHLQIPVMSVMRSSLAPSETSTHMLRHHDEVDVLVAAGGAERHVVGSWANVARRAGQDGYARRVVHHGGFLQWHVDEWDERWLHLDDGSKSGRTEDSRLARETIAEQRKLELFTDASTENWGFTSRLRNSRWRRT